MEISEIIALCVESEVRLSVDKGNLKLVGNLSALPATAISAIKQQKPALIDWLLQHERHGSPHAGSRITPSAEGQEDLLATPTQQQMWLTDQLAGSSSQYHKASALKLHGKLNLVAFKQALDMLVDRHEALRTNFRLDDGNLYQIIKTNYETRVEYHSLTSEIESDNEALLPFLMRLVEHPFDLQNDALLRVHVVPVSQNEHIVLVVSHHLAVDGWSENLLYQELLYLYACLDRGDEPNLPSLPLTFKDYSRWISSEDASGTFAASLEFWKSELDGVPAVHSLPLDHARPARMQYSGGGVVSELSQQLRDKLWAVAADQGTTLYTLLQAAYALLIARWSGVDDVVIGTPVSGRDVDARLANVVGCLNNVLAIRTKLHKSMSFAELLVSSRNTMHRVLQHQTVPLNSVIRALGVDHDASYSPLFQLSFTLETEQQADPGGVWTNYDAVTLPATKTLFDLSLFINPGPSDWQVLWQYADSLFDKESIENMARSYLVLLESIADNARANVYDLKMTSYCQEQWLERHAVGPKIDLTVSHFIELYAKQLSKNASSIAVVDDDQTLTYAELDEWADRLAEFLFRRGVTQGEVVGVYSERSCDLVISLLAVMKVGATYMPIDPSTPPERLYFMIEDSGARLVLSQAAILENLPLEAVAAIPVDEEYRIKLLSDLTGSTLPADLWVNARCSYLIYTSGTTGKPKGLAISQQALVNLCEWHIDRYALGPESRSTFLAGVGFDASIWEMAPSLASGGALVAVSNAERDDPLLLAALFCSKRVTHAFIPTAMLQMLMDMEQLNGSHLRYVLTGGEELKHFKQSESSCYRVFNHYGPSEATVLTTHAEVLSGRDGEYISIGHPIQNTEVYVLNERDQLQPPGSIGELCIAGVNVAEGYLCSEDGQRDLAADVTLHRRLIKLYKTGDYVRYLHDGRLQYLYRRDSQIKLRGFRIEAGEIESRLSELPGTSNAYVTLYEHKGDSRLVVYVESDMDLRITDVRNHLRDKIPSYMIPSALVVVPSLPLTVNGKVDRHALPVPKEIGSSATEPAKDQVEETILSIWKDLLGASDLGVLDNFFDVGGSSILAIKLIHRISAETGVNLSVADMIKHNTVRSQAGHIASLKRSENNQESHELDDSVEELEW